MMTDFKTLMPIRTRGDLPPLFCVHGQPLKTAMTLRAKRPVYGLSHVYYGTFDEKITESIEELAAEYLADMRKVAPRGPYFLLGFSAGAMVAFEIARQLQAGGDDVGQLVLVEPAFVPANQATSGRFAELVEAHAAESKPSLSTLPARIRKSLTARLRFARNLLIVNWCLRTGREIPEDLRWIGYLKSLGPAIDRYAYAPLDCRCELIYGELDNASRAVYTEFWRSILGADTPIHFFEGVRKHPDFMLDHNMRRISELLDANFGTPVTRDKNTA